MILRPILFSVVATALSMCAVNAANPDKPSKAAAVPPNAVDHAGIIQSLDDTSFKNGEEIYKSLCTNCHGADGITAPLPAARAFGKGELKFGADPYSMFLTLTNGNGMMGPQTWMTPKERYEVIHYIRGIFMRPLRKDFKEIDDGYLEGLPTVNVAVSEADKKARDFGPALASQLNRTKSSVLTINLGDDTTISYDLHTMDQAGLWTGGYLNLLDTQHYRERGGGVAQPAGELVANLQSWKWAHSGSFDYPTEDLLPRGPMPKEWLEYHGHYLNDDKVVFSYAIDGRDILEVPGKPAGYGVIEHTFRIGPGRELKLSVAQLDPGLAPLKGYLNLGATTFEVGDSGEVAMIGMNYKTGLQTYAAASVISADGESGAGLSFGKMNRLVLTIEASDEAREFQVLRQSGEGAGNLMAFTTYVASRKPEDIVSPGSLLKGGSLRWAEELESEVKRGSDDVAYTLDTIGLPPAQNPWNVWFRTSSLAFFPDGRMAVSTHGGDVWIVSGLSNKQEKLSWKRFAAGLYEPFGMQVIDGLVYVTCKDRLTRLHDFNQDGEADFYESFYADDDVSVNFHAFNFDLQRDNEGNLYYAKSGQYTDYKLAGSIIKVSPDGKKGEVYCTGLRTPNGMGMMPDGRPTVSDNQGNWMPASKVSLCDPGGFYGYVQTHERPGQWAPDGGRIDIKKVIPPGTFDQPVIWMPQDFDNSSGGQLWVDDKRWGPLSNRLLHTSFGKGWLYYMTLQKIEGVDQASIIKFKLDCDTGIQRARVNPADGQVYAVGLNGWNGNGRKGLSQGGIHRFRYTVADTKMVLAAEVVPEGIRLNFNFALSPKVASDEGRYQIEQWNYRWTANYGSANYSALEEDRKGTDKLKVEEAIPAENGRSVILKLPELAPVNQLKLELKVIGQDGEEFSELVYFTINKMPGKDLPGMKEQTAGRNADRQDKKKPGGKK